ncbi:MAG: hypothetical protein SPL72_08655 [Cyanobacteriota bacterium]|nr:hypothetical protein [Cyanobacteriota bacterium]
MTNIAEKPIRDDTVNYIEIQNIKDNAERKNAANDDDSYSAVELKKEYDTAKDHSSAQLYTSISCLIKYILWIGALFLLLFILCWAYLQYTITFDIHDASSLQRIDNLNTKLENVFNYILTAGIGYASGIARTFFHK